MRTSGLPMRAACRLAAARHQAKAPPTSPKTMPARQSCTSEAGVMARASASGTSNFSSPRAPEVMLAANDAVSAQDSARYSSLPATRTSRAKTQAASGVRNRPAKPAAMPQTRKVLPASRRGGFLPTQCARVAPICTATPSRPALPPNRCVIHVPPMMRGTRRRGISGSVPWPTSNTRPMPRPVFLPKRRYAHAITAPARVRNGMS